MINTILNLNIKNYLWLLFTRKLSRIFKIYFVLSLKKYLPKNNHPLHNLNFFFENQYRNFNKKKFNFNKDMYKCLKRNFNTKQTIRILDFGGENIDLYLFLKKKIPKIHISVINQPKLNTQLKRFINKNKLKKINVFSNTKELKKSKFDFVYFGSSLQYIKNYKKILKILFKIKVKYFYISATSFFYADNLTDKVILKQVNLLPVKLYCYSFNYKYILHLFRFHGYQEIFKKKNPYKKINFRNFSMKIDYLNILFKKND